MLVVGMDWTCDPQLFRDWQGLDLQIGPPCLLIAMPMQVLVMSAAERNSVLVAYLKA
jgi:hypothetical protein